MLNVLNLKHQFSCDMTMNAKRIIEFLDAHLSFTYFYISQSANVCYEL